MTFLNPWGFLALAGLPLVLLIHLFQRRTRRIEVSTLFLVEETEKEEARGRRLERPRSSPLLWLQLAAVVLLTWLLVEPSWLQDDSFQRVVLVVDGSASMTAYRENAATAVEAYARRAERSAARTEWIVIGSDPTGPRLYSGIDREAAVRAALDWDALLGRHDLGPSLTLARSIAGGAGRVILLTDHLLPESELEYERLAVGSPIDNVGFAGVEVVREEQGTRWRAIVKNSGSTRQSRSFWIENEAGRSRTRRLELEPQTLEFLSGTFEERAIELVLEEDGFTLDDRLPLVEPSIKPLRIQVTEEAAALDFLGRFLDTLPAVERTGPEGADVDVDLILAAGAQPEPVESAQLFFLAGGEPTGGYRRGPVVAADHPLVIDLEWGGLLARDGPALAPFEGDRVALWQGERPMLVLRPTRRGQESLLVNFELTGSNADRLPAFVLALYRYVARVRASAVGFERNNFETRQVLELVAPNGDEEPAVREAQGSPPPEVRRRFHPAHPAHLGSRFRLRLPARPGFYRVTQGDEALLEAAVRFGDLREADLTEAGSGEPAPSHEREARSRHSRSDPLSAIWHLLLLALAVAGWSLPGSKA